MIDNFWLIEKTKAFHNGFYAYRWGALLVSKEVGPPDPPSIKSYKKIVDEKDFETNDEGLKYLDRMMTQ